MGYRRVSILSLQQRWQKSSLDITSPSKDFLARRRVDNHHNRMS